AGVHPLGVQLLLARHPRSASDHLPVRGRGARRMTRTYVVTGGGRGVGRAVVERLAGDGGAVVAGGRHEGAGAWGAGAPRVRAVAGDASAEAVADHAADVAESSGRLAGWVNNAAIFRDASVHADPAETVLGLIAANLGLAVVGCTVAVRRFLAAGGGGAIVN